MPGDTPLPPLPDDAPWMREALVACDRGIDLGQGPFGAAVVRGGELVCAAHNTCAHDTDPTAHAEVNAVRDACRRLGTLHLAGCTVYATTEPCPMCFTAIVWSRADRIVWGASVADAVAAGFTGPQVGNRAMAELTGATVAVTGGVLRGEAVAQYARFWDRVRGGG